MNKKNNYAGGLSNYIVLKEEKEVIFICIIPIQIAWKFQQS